MPERAYSLWHSMLTEQLAHRGYAIPDNDWTRTAVYCCWECGLTAEEVATAAMAGGQGDLIPGAILTARIPERVDLTH